MQIEEAIGDLKYYIGEDPYFNGTYDPVTDFEKYCYNNCKAIDIVLNELEKKDKVIDLLADDLRYYEGMQQDQLFCIDTCEGKMCDEEHCKERIKEYFYKKVRNNGAT